MLDVDLISNKIKKEYYERKRNIFSATSSQPARVGRARSFRPVSSLTVATITQFVRGKAHRCVYVKTFEFR